MKKDAAIFICLMLVLFQYQAGFAQSENTKPNIILIVADDLGWRDVGFMGSTFYETPNLDKLAKEGMYFTNAYAAAANCAPSRACLLSGQNTPLHGIYTVSNSDRGEASTRKIIPTQNNQILPDSIFTLAEALKAAGYATATIGKWHLGKNPLTQGFDFNMGGNQKGHNKHFVPYENANIPDGPAGEYLTDRLTNEAISYLEKKSSKPFFLYLPYYAVHTPLQAPAELIKKYQQKTKGKGQEDATYAAMIESLDINIGRLIQKLDKLKLSQNTIIIFTSDNGGIRNISNQDPLRAGKGSYYEGGIRVPLLIKWPGLIKPNGKSDVPVTNLDFYPTILDMVGVKQPKQVQDGTSILPLLKGKAIPNRNLYWHFPIYLEAYSKNDQARDPLFRTRPGSAMRTGDWKLLEYFEDGALELYNLKTDIGEQNNLAASNPEIAKKLHGQLKEWSHNTQAPVPTDLNPKFNPAKMPSTKRKLKD